MNQFKPFPAIQNLNPKQESTATEKNLATSSGWQKSLSQAITDPKQLLKRLQIDPKTLLEGSVQASGDFKLFVTESYLKRIKLGDIHDPLLKQILPLAEELNLHKSYTLDPLEEAAASPIPGLLHKYQGRALIITNGHCAINCRFCFRRNFPYDNNQFNSDTQNQVFDYLWSTPSISEIILSGGDPLLSNTQSLQKLISKLEKIPHIKRLRIHSRIPIVLPERIDKALLALFARTKLKVIMVIHCNHPNEIDSEVSQALTSLRLHCHSLLNQSVLLKGVNNKLETLVALQEALFDNQVQSYYLHVLDKVKGAHHFDIPLNEARELYRELSKSCSGHMLPKLIQENAGSGMKTQLLAKPD